MKVFQLINEGMIKLEISSVCNPYLIKGLVLGDNITKVTKEKQPDMERVLQFWIYGLLSITIKEHKPFTHQKALNPISYLQK